MTRDVKADNSRKYSLHGCIYNTLPETQFFFFLLYILENTDMNTYPNSLASKMKIDTIKGDRLKVFRNNRKVLNVPLKRYIQGGSNMNGTNLYVNKCKQSRSHLNHLVYIGLITVWKILKARYPWTAFCGDFKHFLCPDLDFVTIVHEEMGWEVLQTLSV